MHIVSKAIIRQSDRRWVRNTLEIFQRLQCLGEVTNWSLLALNNTNAYLKVVEIRVPDLPVVTTLV